jgi:hypothetical protein
LTSVDDILALRRPLNRIQIGLFLEVIQRFCRLVAADADGRFFASAAHVGIKRKADATDDDNNNATASDEASLAGALALTASDVFIHALADTALAMNMRAISHVAIGACMVASGWFAAHNGRHGLAVWERLAHTFSPFSQVAILAVRARCIPILLTLTPRANEPVGPPAVLTSIQRLWGHERLLFATSPRVALDFYVASYDDKLRRLQEKTPENI